MAWCLESLSFVAVPHSAYCLCFLAGFLVRFVLVFVPSCLVLSLSLPVLVMSLSCPVLSRPVPSRSVLTCPVPVLVLVLALSRPVLSRHVFALSCLGIFLSCPILSRPVLCCLAFSCPVSSFDVLSCPALSYDILSYPVLPYPTGGVAIFNGCTRVAHLGLHRRGAEGAVAFAPPCFLFCCDFFSPAISLWFHVASRGVFRGGARFLS